MYLIGLTGGIAAGKSTVARRLAELGAYHIDADQVARQAVAPGSDGLAAIAQAFGVAVLSEDGSLDRTALGALVFADGDALASLNRIVHPEVQRLTREAIARIKRDDPDAVIVYDVPLLVEAKVDHPWDLVVTVEAPVETRLERLSSIRGLSSEEAAARIAKQASEDERRAIADVVIDSSGTQEWTIAQADELWRRAIRHQ